MSEPETAERAVVGGDCQVPLKEFVINGLWAMQEAWRDGNQDDGKCRCCAGEPSAVMHKCPFKDEIRNDSTPCNCCESCSRNCAREI